MKIDIELLTPDRWSDFETVFGKSGCNGCWCTWWRVTSKQFSSMSRIDRKEFIRTLVQQGVKAGLIAYVDGIPAGWVTVAPRQDYIHLATSRILAPVDDEPVWSIPCFFVRQKYRHLGLMSQLINAAVEYARAHGAKIIEAYPSDPTEEANPISIYTGIASTFAAAEFKEVIRRKPNRPVMRKYF